MSLDVKTGSNILGHCSAGFMLDAYAHVAGEMQRDVAQRMGSVFARQSETPEKERGSANQKAGTPAFLFWYGPCQGLNKNTQAQVNKSQINPGKSK